MRMRVGVVKPEGLNLRSRASGHADIIDQLPQGDRLIVSDLGTAQDWVFVTVERTGESGFVMRRHVEIVGTTPLPSPPTPRRPPAHYHELALWSVLVAVALTVAWSVWKL